jgi:CBS domain containing-hemolysin-like protein
VLRPPRHPEPTIGTALGLVAVLILVVVNGFFVAAEFALVAVDRGRIETRVADGEKAARTVSGLLPRLSFHLSGAQLGITICSLVLGFLAEPTIAAIIEPVIEPLVGERASTGVAIFIALVLATVFQMVVGELIPKNLAIARPETTALALGAAIRTYSTVFGPVITFLDRSANATVRRMGIEPKEELTRVPTLAEIALLVRFSRQEGTLATNASELLERSIRFAEKSAADALVPRVEVKALGRDASVADLVAASARTGHSRFPVYGTDIDDIEGVVLVKSAHGIAPEDRATTPVSALMTEVMVVPESRELEDLLVDMRGSRNPLVVVVDEYGGTAGILTLEDLVEEIVGEIDDEYDTPTLTVASRAGEWLLPGSLHPDEVVDACGLEMPEGPYETLAGFVLERLGRVPDEPGDTFTHDGWLVEVRGMERHRITRVRLVAPTGGDSGGSGSGGGDSGERGGSGGGDSGGGGTVAS